MSCNSNAPHRGARHMRSPAYACALASLDPLVMWTRERRRALTGHVLHRPNLVAISVANVGVLSQG